MRSSFLKVKTDKYMATSASVKDFLKGYACELWKGEWEYAFFTRIHTEDGSL